MSLLSCDYYDKDFELNDDLKASFEHQLSLIEISQNLNDPCLDASNDLNCNHIDNNHSTTSSAASKLDAESVKWESFFKKHNSGDFFKPRKYILNEFQSYFKAASTALSAVENGASGNSDNFIILEVGAGYGCTILPLVSHFYFSDTDNQQQTQTDSAMRHDDTLLISISTTPTATAVHRLPRLIATDYSPQALSILRNHQIYKSINNNNKQPISPSDIQSNIINGNIDSTVNCAYDNSCNEDVSKDSVVDILITDVWDVTQPPPQSHSSLSSSHMYSYSCCASLVLSIFALSAVHPRHHISCLYNIASVMCSGGYLLFRDYGCYDMTMIRHKHRFEKYLFQRQDGTLCYYFTPEYVEELVNKCCRRCNSYNDNSSDSASISSNSNNNNDSNISESSTDGSNTSKSIPTEQSPIVSPSLNERHQQEQQQPISNKPLFEIIELKYACVKNKNRKKNIEMKRVFLNAVLRKL